MKSKPRLNYSKKFNCKLMHTCCLHFSLLFCVLVAIMQTKDNQNVSKIFHLVASILQKKLQMETSYKLLNKVNSKFSLRNFLKRIKVFLYLFNFAWLRSLNYNTYTFTRQIFG